jgi:predicted DNA-binding protein with PD1-like motif
MDPGDDILEKLTEAIDVHKIKNALILNGIGSVSSHHYHVVSSRVNPPNEIFVKADAPADVISLNGLVLDGRVHAHITLSNDKTSYGGHLEPGTVVLTFLVVSLMPFDNDLTHWDRVGNIG